MDKRAMRAFCDGAMRVVSAAFLAVAALIGGQAGPAQAQTEPPRLALIIANQGYSGSVSALANPHNDARLIAEALRRHGFEIVEVLLDAETRGDVLFSVERYAERLAAAGEDAVGFFYYAGHGLGRPGERGNYLLPIGVTDLGSGRVWANSVRLEEIRELLSRDAPNAEHIVVFDACRDTLRFGRTGRARGFDAVTPRGGMLTAFSTEFDELAEDGAIDAGSGPYAAALAAELNAARGVSAADLFAAVRRRFVNSAFGQRPYHDYRLDRPVFFGEPPPPTPPANGDGREAAALAAFQAAGDDLALLEIVANRFPGTIGADFAAARAEALRSRGGAGRTEGANETPPEARIETTTSPLDGATVFLTGETSELEPLSVFRECDVCPEMVALPGGTFTMGSPESEEGRRSDEGPQQRVTIQPFAMGRTEVTVGQFRRFVEATGRETGDQCWVFENGAWNARSGRSWRNPGFEQTDRSPVVCVNWDDARAYISWLNDQVSGSPYRLPSEAEWEYAARGGRQTAYSFGESAAQLGQYGWSLANSEGGTQPVGRLRPNPFGLYDVHGNVWEWVRDCWNASLDASLGTGRARMTGDCSIAVRRGGSWGDSAGFLRSAFRFGFPRPAGLDGFGFRLARTAVE